MRIVGIYGQVDAGKTTFLQKLVGQEIQKYKKQKVKGITLKVGYLNYLTNNNQNLYFLDAPGHTSLVLETLRNIDLIDYGIYIIDSEVIKDAERLQTCINHFLQFSLIFKTYNIPYCVILNKIDLCEATQIKQLYSKIKERTSSNMVFISPACSLNSKYLSYLKEKIEDSCSKYSKTEKKVAQENIVARIIKSFDVNPVGVPLKVLKGGIIGAYFYKEPKINKTYVVNDLFFKKSEKLNCLKFESCNLLEKDELKIGTLETDRDPFLFKNDQKKGCYVLEQDSEFQVLDRFNVNLTRKRFTPVKGDEVMVLYGGQPIPGSIKKVSKNTLVIVKKSSEFNPIYIGNQKALVFGIKSALKSLVLIGIGEVNKADDQDPR